MKSEFKKGFFGYKIKQTDEHIRKLISEFEKQIGEFENTLQVSDSECLMLEEKRDKIADELEKSKLAVKNLNNWLIGIWDQFRRETEDTFNIYLAEEDKYLKEYNDLKKEYDDDVNLLNNLVKEIFNRTSELKKSLEEGVG